MIDLHTHSSHSDGCLTPKELVQSALKIKLEALALTDHDAVSGLKELHEAAKDTPLEIINGAEISVDYPHTDMEILAMDIPENSLDVFALYQQEEVVRREHLARKRIDLLAKAGIKIRYEEVAYDSKGNLRTQIRRPHFVDVMLKKGYIKTADEAYNTFFAEDGCCYVANQPWPASEAIKFIRDNGAKAILAHPIHTNHKGQDLYNLVKELKGYGLNGIEVFHSSHSKENRKEYLEIIRDLGLITTGGSDYHGGTAHPENELGFGNHKNLNIPYLVIEELRRLTPPTSAYYDTLEEYL